MLHGEFMAFKIKAITLRCISLVTICFFDSFDAMSSRDEYYYFILTK